MRSASGLYWLLPVLLFPISSEAVQDGNNFEAGEIQREIDNEIAKYLQDVKKVLHKDEKRKLMKRSTSASEINLSKLEEAPRFSSIERLYELPDPFAVDVVLFCLPAEKDEDEKCFAASLLTSYSENVDQLVLYTLNGNQFVISDRTEVKNGRSLATHNIGGVQYIVVAENRLVDSNETVSDLFVSPVYAVNSQTGRLRRLHYLGDGHLTDAIIWEQKGTDHVFLATASAAIEGSQPGDVSHVYRWMGNHFDMTHTVATSNASRITHFTIGGNMFLAVANTGTDAANMFSAVYMYNLHEERFVLHQKLPTYSATDIKSFTLHLADGSETFLAVTSSDYNNHFSVIIYKLLPDSYHFVPMQLLPLEGIEDSEGTEGIEGIEGTEGGRKGTENGTEETGGAELLLPVVHEDASGVLASVLLVASRKWGLKVYQYDGWRFVLSETQLNQQEFGPGISSMRLFRFKGRNVVTLVNKRSVSLVFSVKWKVNDVMKALQSNLESWCDQVLKEEEDLETASNNLLREAQWAPKLNESFETGGCLIFDNPNTLIRTVEITKDVTKPDNEAVRRKFEEVRQEVKKTEETLKQITQKELVFEEPVVLESADFKCLHGCVFLNLEIGTLNGENFSTFLDNSHGLTRKHVDKIDFETLNVTSHTTVDKINGRPIKHLVTSDGDEDLRFDINVNGRVIFNGKLTVNGEIDGVKFDYNTLLLDSGVQFFNNSELRVESLIVDKLTVKNQQPQFKSTEINNVEVESLGNNFIPVLDVKELILDDNKISGVDFGDFVEKTLKKTGGKVQIVEGFHHYKVLIAEEIDAPNYKPVYESGVEFEGNKVGDEIVEHGKPRGDKVEDVKQISENDKVGDVKTEDLIIDQTKKGNDDVDENSDPTLHKKCSGAQCVEEQFRIDGDFEIDGRLVIENATLFVEDVYLGHENISLSDLLKNGLKLDGGMISDVVFEAPIYVQHLDVDSVNHINPNSWIDGCDPGNQPIVVTGHKVFTDSLNLEKGGSVTGRINEIPVDSLMFDTLRKDGDQDVGGFKHIGKITAKVIESDSLSLKNDDVTGKAKTHSGGDLVVNHMKGRLLRAKTINGVVLEEVINDTLFKDNETYVVESKTTFTNDLKTDELFCDDVYELSNHTNERRMTGDATPVRNTTDYGKLTLNFTDVEGKQLKVDRLYFTGSLDGISAEDFGNWLLVEGDQTIESVCKIENVEAKNGVKLTTGLLNGVDLDQFVKDMINIDEPVVLSSDVVFEGEVVVENGVKIGGLVNGVEFSEEELVLKGVDPVVFGGEKLIEGGLQAKSIDVEALKTFCKVVVEPQDDGELSKPLTVVGNVEFSKEPTITFLNNHNVSELSDSLWFVDEDIIIDHDMVLGDVVLKGHLNMSSESEVNGKNLTRLREEYFSLSADQKITNDLIFDKITADGLRVVERVQAYDLVAGMNFDEFVGSVMRQKRRQRVTAILDFEDVEVDGVLNANASWTVNGLDFKKDLMRWNNSVNIVRGETRLTSLKAQSLAAKPGVLIQGIDISRWKQLAVTGSGRFNVSGHKTFDCNVYVDEDLRVHGLVNDIRFDADSVLLSERYQTVSGHYLFGPETVLDVEDILSNSLVDGVNITYLLDQQVCKEDTNHLITGSKTFRSRFSVANQVEMRRHFADIDLVQLHNQLMSPYEGLAKDNRLTALASIGKDVELSLATRAHLFTGWEKVAQVAGRVRLALPLDGKMERVVFVGRFSAEEVRMRLSLNYWDVRGRKFVETGERRFFMTRPIDATVVETASGENRLFTLFKSSNASVRTGVIYNVSSNADGSLSHVSVGTFDTSAANRMLYLTDNCFLLWGQQVLQCYVYCSWQRVFSFQCSDVNQIIRFRNDSAVHVLMAKSTGVVEVRSFVENELQYVATLAVSQEPVLRMDVISQPITHHSILVACGETAVSFMRFDLNWQKMDSASLSLQQASARLLALPTNEIVAIVMSSCSPPTTYKWAGLSQPQAANLPIAGSEVRQVYQFQDSQGANYTLVVSDRETAVLRPLYFIDDFEA